MGSGIEKALRRTQNKTLAQKNISDKSIARITGKRSKDISRRVEAQRSLSRMEDSYQLSPDELTEQRIISASTADTPVGNAMRELRGKIVKEFGDEGLVISIVSIVPNSGSSFVTLNLAAAIAFDESKSALVIDCNIDRTANQHPFGDKEVGIGISDYLENDDIDEADIILASGIKRVRYVPAGSEFGNAAEQYNSVKFQQFIDTASSRYDNRYVILDTPPILESADTSILVDLSDAVILVLPYGKVGVRQLEDALSIIGKDRIMGVVMNDEPGIGSYLGNPRN
jgi:Mrp family chromosome partitioning ATPase